jgi:hypothetical protein
MAMKTRVILFVLVVFEEQFVLVNRNPHCLHLKRRLPSRIPQPITSKLPQPQHLILLSFSILKKFIVTNFDKLSLNPV